MLATSEKLQIMVITQSLYPYVVGGAEIHAYQTSRRLSLKHNIRLITEVSRPHRPLLSSVLFVMKAVELAAKSEKTDVVHCHQAFVSSIAGLLIYYIKRTPFIITCHGSDIRIMKKNPLIKLVQRIALSRASYITCVSKDVATILEREYRVPKNRITVIPNGYDVDFINRAKQETATDSNRQGAKLVFVGSLRSAKSPQTLFEGFKRVLRRGLDIQLYVVGDGPLRPRLEQYCVNNSLVTKVSFLGTLPHEKALKVIATSTIFINTSIEEGLPTSLVEAMALGKPVIATAVGGIPEVVKDGINGVLVPPESSEHVAKALERLLTDPELRRKLGEAAAESVKDYTWGKIAEKYEIMYQKALRSRSQRC